MLQNSINYFLIRLLGFPISWLPYATIHRLGQLLGSLLYCLQTKRRKRALSNLSIARLHLSKKQLKKIARGSFQNLAITCLEFYKLSRKSGKIDSLIHFDNFDLLQETLKKGCGAILFCGHMANWEAPLLGITRHIQGTAIGKPINNRRLYRWILSIRQKYGAKIIPPKEAMRAGLASLREGKILGIVGDQAYPESSYHYPLFGIRSWTSSSPALLSYRSGAPVISVEVKRERGFYRVRFFEPLWPPSAPLRKGMKIMMDQIMQRLEHQIKDRPQDWLWQHNRFKQTGVNHVQRTLRHDFHLVILPCAEQSLLEQISILHHIYPRGFFTFLLPAGSDIYWPGECKTIYWQKKQDLFLPDGCYQFVWDFTNTRKLRHHFLKNNAFAFYNFLQIEKKACQMGISNAPLCDKIARLVCKPSYFKENHASHALFSPAHLP